MWINKEMDLRQWNIAIICMLPVFTFAGCGANSDMTASVNAVSDNIPVVSWDAVSAAEEPTAEELLNQELEAGDVYTLSLSQNGIPVATGMVQMSEEHIRMSYETEAEETFAYSNFADHKMIMDSLEELPNRAVASYNIENTTICIDILGFTQEAGYGVYFSENQKNAWKMRCYPDGTCEVEDSDACVTVYDYYWGFDGHLFLHERTEEKNAEEQGQVDTGNSQEEQGQVDTGNNQEDTVAVTGQTDYMEEKWEEYIVDASSEGWLRLSRPEE
ncbi:MAG: hypothetical protein ACI4DU_02240 [Lachnospiraceae bacterium]